MAKRLKTGGRNLGENRIKNVAANLGNRKLLVKGYINRIFAEYKVGQGVKKGVEK